MALAQAKWCSPGFSSPTFVSGSGPFPFHPSSTLGTSTSQGPALKTLVHPTHLCILDPEQFESPVPQNRHPPRAESLPDAWVRGGELQGTRWRRDRGGDPEERVLTSHGFRARAAQGQGPGGWPLGRTEVPGAGQGLGGGRSLVRKPNPAPRGGIQRTPAFQPHCPWRVEISDPAFAAVPQFPGPLTVQLQLSRSSQVGTYLRGLSPLAGSEVSAAARPVPSARTRPRALQPWHGPLGGALPGGRALLPPHLFPSLFFLLSQLSSFFIRVAFPVS